VEKERMNHIKNHIDVFMHNLFLRRMARIYKKPFGKVTIEEVKSNKHLSDYMDFVRVKR
jgi:hypothetical protein|tara:strand:+ start:52 stop:228 length:177 start_codon:yes stop_codon:yes gene_type:complete